MKKSTLVILVLLAVHLLYTNTNLLLKLTEAQTTINEILRFVFAGSYSAITVLILSIYPKRHVFVISGLLDGLSVTLNYIPLPVQHIHLIIGLFFGIYTSFIAIIIGEIKLSEKNKQNEKQTTENKIILNNEKNELLNKKRSIQNALNRIKNEEKKRLKKQELVEVEYQLKELTKNLS
jgi:hypothetical protein